VSSDAIGEGQLASTEQVEERRVPLTLRADGQSGGFKFLGCRRGAVGGGNQTLAECVTLPS
jgi:hypothetical protein